MPIKPELVLGPAAIRRINGMDSSSKEDLASKLESFFRSERKVASARIMELDGRKYRMASLSKDNVIFRELTTNELRHLNMDSAIEGYFIIDIFPD